MYDIHSDSAKFQSCKLNNNISYLAKFPRFFGNLKANGMLNNDYSKQLYPSSTSTTAIYGLPKVHKPAAPLRPVLLAIGSFNREAAKWLTYLFLKISSNLKDFFKFVDNIKYKYLNASFQNKIMIYSFDVKSLFSNIPISFTIKLIIDALYHNIK